MYNVYIININIYLNRINFINLIEKRRKINHYYNLYRVGKKYIVSNDMCRVDLRSLSLCLFL